MEQTLCSHQRRATAKDVTAAQRNKALTIHGINFLRTVFFFLSAFCNLKINTGDNNQLMPLNSVRPGH